MKKRVLSFILVLCMVCALLPLSAFAADVIDSGTCGDNLSWTFKNGVLTISGTGDMYHFDGYASQPWYDIVDQITEVAIENGVTSIGFDAFIYCDSLASVTIPDSVIYIEPYAFAYCRNLTSVTIPDSVEEIGYDAFCECHSLASVTIPDSVMYIGELAFAHCRNLTSVTIPYSVKRIGEVAFLACNRLMSINVSPDNEYYCSENGVLFNKNVTELIQYPIGNEREQYHIPDSVMYIGKLAFAHCRNLTSVTIPYSVKEIGEVAFIACNRLMSINVSPDNEYYCSENGVLFNKNVTELIQYPIGNEREQYHIPDSVTSLGDGAFRDCDSLTSVTIGNGVTYIGDNTFLFCDSLTDVYYSGSEEQWNAIDIAAGNDDLINATIHFSGDIDIDDNIYNIGEETYSFENYKDNHSNGHCFGMSITSAGYYLKLLDASNIGAADGKIYNLTDTEKIREPICYYQDIQGSKSSDAIVAGGSFYLNNAYNISSDWESVVNYVKDHQYDDKGMLQIGFRKDCEGGHAINFLRYSVVNGEERIYAYDNNFPTEETYFYRDTNGKVRQAPKSTFSGSIDCIALRSVTEYFNAIGDYFDSDNNTEQAEYVKHAIFAEKGSIAVAGAVEFPIDTDAERTERVVFEVPEEVETVSIKPLTDNAAFTYLDEEYGFGEIDEDTIGVLILSDSAEENNAEFIADHTHSYVDGECTVCHAKDPNYNPSIKENPFVDVKEGSVYYDAILWAYYHTPQQITGGFTATEFRPQNPCTRAQVVTFLWRAKGCPEPTTSNNPFSDVSAKQSNGKDNPYYKAILWAAEEGITTGYAGGLFKPNDTVTRAQFVTFLWRADGKPATGGSINGFADAASIATPYQQAVAWAVERGITTGYEDNTFRPNAACTRWAVVLFMYRDMA